MIALSMLQKNLIELQLIQSFHYLERMHMRMLLQIFSIKYLKKITQLESPKLGRKPTPSRVQDLSARPPRRPLVRNDSSKHVTEKFDRTTTHSVISLPRKNAYENASPNIQH
jgi:hypothetical protein